MPLSVKYRPVAPYCIEQHILVQIQDPLKYYATCLFAELASLNVWLTAVTSFVYIKTTTYAESVWYTLIQLPEESQTQISWMWKYYPSIQQLLC